MSWNVGEWESDEILATIERELPDVMFLTEFRLNPKVVNLGKTTRSLQFKVDLNKLENLGYVVNFPDKRVCICYKQLNIGEIFTPIDFNDRVGLLEYENTGIEGSQVYFFGLHLVDKQYRTEFDQFVEAQKQANAISDYCMYLKSSKFIVLGDFNMNPWE